MAFVGRYKDRIMHSFRRRIRERAITQAKARIALSGRKLEEFSEDELEIIVADEEHNVRGKLKQSGIVALLITLGLS